MAARCEADRPALVCGALRRGRGRHGAGRGAGFLATPNGAAHFAVFRLAAYGIYLHGVLLLLVSGGLLWKSSRRLACGWLAIAVVLLGVAGDAFLIEPHWLEVTHREFVSQQSPGR